MIQKLNNAISAIQDHSASGVAAGKGPESGKSRAEFNGALMLAGTQMAAHAAKPVQARLAQGHAVAGRNLASPKSGRLVNGSQDPHVQIRGQQLPARSMSKAEAFAQAKIGAAQARAAVHAAMANASMAVPPRAMTEEQRSLFGVLGNPKLVSERSGLGEVGTPSAEMSPRTQVPAAGVNTGQAIAGLKPWSRDWVFSDRDDPAASQVKPLFGGKDEIHAPELHQAVQGQAQQQSAHATRGVADGMMPLAGIHELASGLGKVEGTRIAHANPNPAVNPLVSGFSGEEFMNARKGAQEFGHPGSGQQHPNGDQAKPDLRLISGGNGPRSSAAKLKDLDRSELFANPNLVGAQLGNPMLHAAHVRHGASPAAAMMGPAVNLTGHVTQGAGDRDRLTSESLNGIASGIRAMGVQGGGEMQIRLKPGNLGELHLKVVTNGNEVGLRIQASDEHAKKILEESLSHLKDSLAAHNLSLGKVDLAVAQAGASFGSSHTGADQQRSGSGQGGQQSQGRAFQGFNQGGWSSGNPSAGHGRQNAWSGNDVGSFSQRRSSVAPAAAASSAAASARAHAARAADGRLNVMA